MNGRFVALEPPADGLQSALAEGRRRRRRRTAGTSAAGATALAGALAVSLLSAPGGGTDSLRPPPAAPGGLSSLPPGASVTPEPAPTVPAATATAAGGRPSETADRPPRSAQPAASPRPAPGGASPDPEAGDYRTPDLLRAYVGPPATRRLCGAVVSNDSEETRAVGWCVAAVAERTGQGADLIIEVCRDGASSAGRLSFATDREVDLAVLQDGRTLWQWSVSRPAREVEHELAAESGGCWSWRAPWTGVDQEGNELDSGGYVLRVRSEADELAGVAPTDQSFTL